MLIADSKELFNGNLLPNFYAHKLDKTFSGVVFVFCEVSQWVCESTPKQITHPYSIREYGCAIWGGAAKSYVERLERVQHKFIMWMATPIQTNCDTLSGLWWTVAVVHHHQSESQTSAVWSGLSTEHLPKAKEAKE